MVHQQNRIVKMSKNEKLKYKTITFDDVTGKKQNRT